MIRQRVIVRGQVQGVGFRWSARSQANRLGVAGFARNLDDGSLELELQGSALAVERMVEWLHRGPSQATVESVEVTELSPVKDTGFELH